MMKNSHKKSLELVKKFIEETPQSELDEMVDKYSKLDIGGPTIREYLDLCGEKIQIVTIPQPPPIYGPYLKCDKCGNKVKLVSGHGPIPCMQSAPWRTSGICGGSYRIEITEDEFKLES